MLPVGMLLMWAGYSVSLWGWCLIRGYDVTLGQLMSPTHPYGSGKGQAWPPPLMSPDVIFPGGRNTGASAAPGAATSAPGKKGTPQPANRIGPGGVITGGGDRGK
jgi:hypothetical protein